MSEHAIRADGLSKQYRLGSKQQGYKTLRETLTETFVSPFRRAHKLLSGQAYGAAELDETIWALKDVSLEIKRGEVVGIIGPNGAGKTTLLKILSRITEPTEGQAEINGRVGSLLEVGTGFHPELTGRENIYLNGAILGMKKVEIERKLDEIVSFAEIDKFIDTPVKHYSSGMYVRLAFAVAAHLEPEILLVDEVLAVGDIAFQKKCLGKMGDVVKEGRTVLFVSHNMAAIESLCGRAILLKEGTVEMIARTRVVIDRYLESIATSCQSVFLGDRTDRRGSGVIRLTDFFMEDQHGDRVKVVQSGQQLAFVFTYKRNPQVHCNNVVMAFHVATSSGHILFLHQNAFTGQRFDGIPPTGRFVCHIPRLPLVAGRYRVVGRVTVGGDEADYLLGEIGQIDVIEGDFFGSGNPGVAEHSPFLVEGTWRVEEEA
jgi:lipopolysaccharide transport system ATP-binding protein